MKLIVKCWKTKQNKIVKGMFYETERGRFLLTFDKWAIIAVLGAYAEYNALKEGDEIIAGVTLYEVLSLDEVLAFDKGGED